MLAQYCSTSHEYPLQELKYCYYDISIVEIWFYFALYLQEMIQSTLNVTALTLISNEAELFIYNDNGQNKMSQNPVFEDKKSNDCVGYKKEPETNDTTRTRHYLEIGSP